MVELTELIRGLQQTHHFLFNNLYDCNNNTEIIFLSAVSLPYLLSLTSLTKADRPTKNIISHNLHVVLFGAIHLKKQVINFVTIQYHHNHVKTTNGNAFLQHISKMVLK